MQTGIALFAERMPVDLVSQFFLEQMLGLGYFATSISLNILAVRPLHRSSAQSSAVLASSH